MKNFELDKFLLYVFSPLMLGMIVGFLFKDNYAFLEQVNRNIVLSPIVFVVVWSVLYVLMGIWYYLFDKAGGEAKYKKLYWILLIINLLFTPFLFYFHNFVLALIDVIFLIIGIAYLFYISLKKKYRFAYLLIPYLLWLLIALSLVLDLIINN